MNAIAIKMTPVKGEWIVYEDRDPNGLRRAEPCWITSTPGRLRVRPDDRFELHLYPGQGATAIEALVSLGIADQVYSLSLESDVITSQFAHSLQSLSRLRELSVSYCRGDRIDDGLSRLSFQHLSVMESHVASLGRVPAVLRSLIFRALRFVKEDTAAIVDTQVKRLRLWTPVDAHSLAKVMSMQSLERIEILELSKDFDADEWLSALAAERPAARPLELVAGWHASSLADHAEQLAKFGISLPTRNS
jgi:hypothetical protein